MYDTIFAEDHVEQPLTAIHNPKAGHRSTAEQIARLPFLGMVTFEGKASINLVVVLDGLLEVT